MNGDKPTSAGTSERSWGAAGLPLLLTVGIAIGLGLRIGLVWDELPPTMASHFGAGGRPDAFMSKEFFFIFTMIVGGGSVAAIDRMSGVLGWMGMATAAIVAVAVELVVQSNLHRSNFANDAFLIFLGAYFALVIASVVWMIGAFKVPKEEA